MTTAKPSITDKEYVEKGGNCCPFCGSDEIEGGSCDFEGSTVTVEVGCLVCDEEWDDVYSLTGFIAK